MGNFIYCGDKIDLNDKKKTNIYASLDDDNFKNGIVKDEYEFLSKEHIDFINENIIYNIGQEAFELLEYNDDTFKVGFSDQLLRGLIREFKTLTEYHMDNKEMYLYEEAKTRKRGI